MFVVCNQKLLLQFRDDLPWILNPNTWALPGGGVEAGENFFQCMAREMLEELGVEFQLQILGVSPKGNCYFFAEIDEDLAHKIVSRKKEDVKEGQEFRFVCLCELDQLPLGGVIKKYWEKYREPITAMVQSGKAAKGCDLGLFIWNGGRPSPV